MEKLKQIFKTIGQAIVKYWALLLLVAGVVFIYLFDRRGRTIDQLSRELAIEKLKRKLEGLNNDANKNEEDFRNKLNQYNELKRKHNSGSKPPAQ